MYIRTKDGIYEFNKTFNGASIRIIYGNEITKQSENLEELFDRFVVMDKETKEVISIVSFLAYAKLWSYCKYNIYGAVWCEWGLKYVAKLDDKGKLELI